MLLARIAALVASLLCGVGCALRQVAADGLRLPDSSRKRSLPLSMGCPEFLSALYEGNASSRLPYRSFTITKGAGYGYIALHFSKLWMPSGSSIVLRGVENVDVPDVVFNLSGIFRSGVTYEPVDAPPLLAKELRVELYRDVGPSPVGKSSTAAVDSASDRHCYGFAIDYYNYALVDDARNITPSNEATCANDNSKEAVCYYQDSSTRTAFLAARAVARLLIKKEDGKSYACTGWLLGSQGHLITNYHCINSTAQATSTNVEFMAEASNCSQNCQTWGTCSGTVEAIATQLVYANEALDYALVKPLTNVDLAAKYGYLRLKETQGHVGQEIYVPQHPQFYGKRIAMTNDFGTKTTILNISADGCGTTGYSYNADTEGGSSGSPVIDALDHGVVALHHCGVSCANTGIPSVSIIADLKEAGLLPISAVDSGDNKNTLNFPAYQPPEISSPPVLSTMLTFNGAILFDSSSGTVSVDQFEFALENNADVSFDVLAAEVSEDAKFKDLNGDCQATYLDATIFLFHKGDNTTVLVNDDDKSGDGRSDGSISKRDPFARTFLKSGTYVLALGAMPISSSAAFDGVVKMTGNSVPEIYTCFKHTQVGSYRLQFKSSQDMTFPQLPPAVAAPGSCALSAAAICSS